MLLCALLISFLYWWLLFNCILKYTPPYPSLVISGFALLWGSGLCTACCLSLVRMLCYLIWWEPFWKREPQLKKCPPLDRPVDKALVHFMDWWLMGERPAHHWQHYPLTGDPGYHKVAGEQVTGRRALSSIPLWPPYHLLPRVLPCLCSCPDFLADELWCGSIREITFSSRVICGFWCFITVIGTLRLLFFL